MKDLDRKLERIRGSAYTPRDFILAHEGLHSHGLRPQLALEFDLAISDPVLAGEGD